LSAAPELPDLRRVTDVFARHGVDCLFVGGIAARAQGAQRLTFDVDCLAERSEDNLDRLAAAIRELHARLRVEGLSDEDAAQLPVAVTGSTLVRMEISTWRTDAGNLDVLAAIPDRNGRQLLYDELAARAAVLDLDGIAVRVAALDDVIASKERADRPKDRDALLELHGLRRQQHRGDVERASDR